MEVRESVPARLAFFLGHALARNTERMDAALTPEVDTVARANEVFPRILAQGYALAGMPERALSWLEMAVGGGFINYPFLTQYDPFLESLRTHPRFLRLMETVRDRWKRFDV